MDIMMQALSDVRELRNPDKRIEGEKKGKEEKDKKNMEEQDRREKEEQEQQEQQDPVSPPVLLPAKDGLISAQSETSSAEPQTAETGAQSVQEIGEGEGN